MKPGRLAAENIKSEKQIKEILWLYVQTFRHEGTNSHPPKNVELRACDCSVQIQNITVGNVAEAGNLGGGKSHDR